MKRLAFALLVALALVACAERRGAPTSSPAPAGVTPSPISSPVATAVAPEDLRPRPDDVEKVRGPVYGLEAELVSLESFPPQFALDLRGYLPTPCHRLRALVGHREAQETLFVEVYSVVGREEVCVQVLQPFRASLPLGTLPAGTRVLVNGKLVGTAEEGG